jgi:hypothetical protein
VNGSPESMRDSKSSIAVRYGPMSMPLEKE